MEKQICPECRGEKVVKGNCECHSEWRTTDENGQVDDCICEPDQECPACGGTGYVNG